MTRIGTVSLPVILSEAKNLPRVETLRSAQGDKLIQHDFERLLVPAHGCRVVFQGETAEPEPYERAGLRRTVGGSLQ